MLIVSEVFVTFVKHVFHLRHFIIALQKRGYSIRRNHCLHHVRKDHSQVIKWSMHCLEQHHCRENNRWSKLIPTKMVQDENKGKSNDRIDRVYGQEVNPIQNKFA